ncbi:MAG: hypothetical protein COA45_01995 [Zetaproteobacteria bacterium]|nr:MAG: hypothetical protein COA45_01995 [Zetaproteobacteria bacterium]
MTDKQHEIPLKDIEPPQKNEKKKGGLTSFLLILIGLGVFFMSPIPSYLKSLIPESLVKSMFSSAYQDIVLEESSRRIETPIKYAKDNPLPVLGRDTGICFSFTLDTDRIDKQRKEDAIHGQKIAEVIAISTEGTEYILNNVTLNETNDKIVICQTFGKRESLIPDYIKAIYIRPLQPFTPSKIIWVTIKDIY